jgi:extracellular factor (EF) 3-hydroxypalmitic acid methyl ester biosynthesis protein
MKNKRILNPKIQSFIKNWKDFSTSRPVRQFLVKLDYTNQMLQKEEQKISNLNYAPYKRNIYKLLNNLFSSAGKLENHTKDKILLNELRKLFRSILMKFTNKSKLIRHGTLKPKGFPGDFKIVEAMYDNKSVSKGIGFLLDSYFLQNDYVKAVRDRKDQMKIFLLKFIQNCQKKDINIVNLACGSCREIRELKGQINESQKRILFNLIDQDKEAVNFAKMRLKREAKESAIFKFHVIDVLEFFKREYADKKADIDLIYSIGLIDYLPNSILGPMFRQSFSFIRRGGEIIVAHKNTKKYNFIVSLWGSDWSFIPRDLKDVKFLIAQYLPKNKYRIKLLPSNNNRIFYISITKK